MKELIINRNAAQQLLEMKEKLLDIASDFLYTPMTKENLTYMKCVLDEVVYGYNFIFSIHDFQTYIVLENNITDIFGGIHFKELSTGEEVTLIVQEG